jgi:GTPase SAR1 family protein
MEPRPSERVDHLLKLLLVGDSSVGKSSLLVSFFDGVFEVRRNSLCT